MVKKFKLPKGKITVEDILANNELAEQLAELKEALDTGKVDGLLLAWVDTNGETHTRAAWPSWMELVGMLECFKQEIIEDCYWDDSEDDAGRAEG